uniref:C-type lectin domain-containing protein n=1 Tax=Oreochromis aureus TaxID=47969 RepID=A0A668UMK2_OREAU
MKTVLLLSALLYAALAAPAEEDHEASAQEFEGADTPQSHFSFCPDGWFSYGSRCFKFINSPKSWISAEEYCNSLGGNLASVANPREYSFLQQMTQTAGRTTAWLGGFRLQNQWLWIDREGFYYTNWYSQSSSSSYSCLYLQSAYGWSNTQCTSSNPFICSKNAFGC